MNRVKDIKGQRFGKLIVIEYKYSKNKNAYWSCQCDCGNIIITMGNSLRSGKTKSCGCWNKEKSKVLCFKHGLCNSRIYHIWCGIKRRCNNPNDINYNNYGKRGIKICDEWSNDFNAFYKWALKNDYNDTLTIDRIDVNGNYEPSNCRWTTYRQQLRNYSRNHNLTYKGETLCMTDFAKKYNIKVSTLSNRLRNGWTIEQALTISTKGFYKKVK